MEFKPHWVPPCAMWNMQRARELQQTPPSSSSVICIDLTDDLAEDEKKPVNFSSGIQPGKEKAATLFREESRKPSVKEEPSAQPHVKEEQVVVPKEEPTIIDLDTYDDVKEPLGVSMVLDPPQKSIYSTNLATVKVENTQSFETISESGLQDEQARKPSVKEEQVVAAKEEVQNSTIIDLDSYDGVEEPQHMSMALVVVPDPPQDTPHSTELGMVRVDDSESCDTISQSGLQGEQAINEFHPGTPEIYPERQRLGHGHTAPRPGGWTGPPRWASSQVGILTVQCARCLKWRVVPSREIYEAIREHILETPWLCENALQWRPDAHCGLPTDLNQDSSSLWAIDRPNLPSSPPGWQRKVTVRGDGSTKFADVYYTTPDGKTLRSMPEVAKFLEENPWSVPVGTKLSQFSYTIPRPLPGMWSPRKRNPMRPMVGIINSSQGNYKKARAPQPLARQLAQKRFHSTTAPLPPMAPTSLLPPTAPSFQVPVGAFAPGPSVPQIVQPLACQMPPAYPPLPTFIHPSSSQPLFSSALPPVQSRHLLPPSFVGNSSQLPRQSPLHLSQQGQSPSNGGRPDPVPMSALRTKARQQQKSRLGGTTLLSQELNLPGILPLRD